MATPMDQDIPELNEFLCFEIYASNLSFGRVYKPVLDPLGLTYPQFLVLYLLWRKDARSVGEIAGALGLETSTLTPLIKRLEQAGFVTRKRDPSDERRVKVSLAPRGEAARTHLDEIRDCVGRATGLTLEEAQELQASLRKLRTHLAAS
ncbi:MarR family transcriptional regulator [Thioclava sp. BHET1]|nr:MarR family transcriptional regulator [Thioclava sp. BHET1]